MNKPGIPKGTRDFSPQVMVNRNYIFATIRQSFERYGYMPLETPSMENLETLTGKYGEEGDQLIFKILNNGDYLKDANADAFANRDSKKLTYSICDRALRYDLTVPFARFVVMNQNDITFPFKRYQIQPVWRADRPQKGRYREFYQCDVDVVGSDSLLNEVELVQIADEVLSNLGLRDFTIKINNRKILNGIAEIAGVADRMMTMTVAIDKLDKVGEKAVLDELRAAGFGEASLEKIGAVLNLSGTSADKLNVISEWMHTSEIGNKGVEEMRFLLEYTQELGMHNAKVEFDLTLARGLNYYTGAIFEVKVNNVQMGSISGGGRYDDLTGIFGLPGISGVGISFGADRIYDVLVELNLFPDRHSLTTKLLFVNFGTAEEKHCMKMLKKLRDAGINSELYPEAAKIKKQMKYADDKGIPFVALVGTSEIQNGTVTLKNMKSGEQQSATDEQLIELLQKA